MKSITKFFLAIASLFIVIGLGISVYVMNEFNWDFSKLNTTQYNKVSYEINDVFNSIEIDCNTIDIAIKPSSDDNYKVEVYESDKIKYDVKVDENKLIINEIDERELIDYIGIKVFNNYLTLYVPNDKYESLNISITTGDLTIEDLSIDNINLNFTTGDIYLNNINCNYLNIKGTTGDVYLNNVIVTNEMIIKNTTGDITLNKCDASYIKINTTTGDIECILLSNKNFIVSSVTGDYNVPSSIGESNCELTTTTGDIDVEIED